MRVMKRDGAEVTVMEHIIIRNFWEYYVLKRGRPSSKNKIRFCYVVGVESEFGDVNLAEVEPHIISRTSDLSEVMPPPGWSWT